MLGLIKFVMAMVNMVILVGSIIMMLIGMVKPTVALFWLDKEKVSKMLVAKVYLVAFIIGVILLMEGIIYNTVIDIFFLLLIVWLGEKLLDKFKPEVFDIEINGGKVNVRKVMLYYGLIIVLIVNTKWVILYKDEVSKEISVVEEGVVEEGTNKDKDDKNKDLSKELEKEPDEGDKEVAEDEDDYNIIIKSIADEEYIKADDEISKFISNHKKSSYIKDVKDLKKDIKDGLDNEIKENEDKRRAEEAHQNKIDSEIVQSLMSKGLSEKTSLLVYDILKDNDIPDWGSGEIELVEDFGTGSDFILKYETSGGDFSEECRLKITNGVVESIVGETGDVAYDKNGLNKDFKFAKDVSITTLMRLSKKMVDSLLASPSTAKYPGSFLSPYDKWYIEKIDGTNIIELSSYVDSQNYFGAVIRNDFTVRISYSGNNYKGIYMEVDNKVYLDASR